MKKRRIDWRLSIFSVLRFSALSLGEYTNFGRVSIVFIASPSSSLKFLLPARSVSALISLIVLQKEPLNPLHISRLLCHPALNHVFVRILISVLEFTSLVVAIVFLIYYFPTFITLSIFYLTSHYCNRTS